MAPYDIIIVGGGPAGLTAALYAARAGKQVLVLERGSLGGQIVYAPMVENYPGIPSLQGQFFAESLAAQVEALGVEIEYEEVLSVIPGSPYKVVTDVGEHTAPAVILATGTVHRTLGLPDEDNLIGAGISYCALCDGPFYQGRSVGIVGGGNSAAQEALFLSGICEDVTVILRRDVFRADAALVARLRKQDNIRILYNTVVTDVIVRDGTVSGVRVNTAGTMNTVDLECLFIAIGHVPNSEAFQPLGITAADGFFSADESTRTGIPGLFVAGDCRSKAVRQLTTACGDGAAAATAACQYLNGAIL